VHFASRFEGGEIEGRLGFVRDGRALGSGGRKKEDRKGDDKKRSGAAQRDLPDSRYG